MRQEQVAGACGRWQGKPKIFHLSFLNFHLSLQSLEVVTASLQRLLLLLTTFYCLMFIAFSSRH